MMRNNNRSEKAIEFYSNHPINYNQIMDVLKENNISLDSITQESLSKYDQDHYDGSNAIDILIKELGIQKKHKVLDLCCGIGGTVRYIADKCKCSVMGIDLTNIRIEAARKLSKLVHLDDVTEYITADACDMLFQNDSFDRLVSQEALYAIPDKKKLFTEVYRVLKTSGKIGLTDIIELNSVDYNENPSYYEEWNIYNLLNKDRYINTLKECGFKIVKVEDLSLFWKNLLKKRYEMYNSLKLKTEKQFGNELQAKWDKNYRFIRLTRTFFYEDQKASI
ncbi:MAG: methyltransferase domain-containing protein [Desulfobacteraceae bacterium]|nr:methyltransferase domain-containing protein [Desulfobacteraceae bacterium]